MNSNKLKTMTEQVRIGGKGTPRRKKKVTHSTIGAEEKKLEAKLKKLAVNQIIGVEEANILKNDGTVINFNNPKARGSLSANTFSVTGHSTTSSLWDMYPGLMGQPKSLNKNDYDVSDLVGYFDKVQGAVFERTDSTKKSVVDENETCSKE